MNERKYLMNEQNEILIYRPNAKLQLQVRLENETIWLTQSQIADLFAVQRPAITKHLGNIFASHELKESAVSSILEHTAADGKTYQTKFYNLDAILSVGYRVNSINATHFRQWANKVLKDYILRGYAINNRVANLEQRVTKTEQQIEFFVKTALPPHEGVFFDGQVFDAYVLASNFIKHATKRVVLIDNYVDESVLTLLDKRASNVNAIIYTSVINKQLKLDIEKHNAQYSPIEIRKFVQSHDRFLIIDDDVYHLGASLKDLGKKWFAFSKINEITSDELIRRLN